MIKRSVIGRRNDQPETGSNSGTVTFWQVREEASVNLSSQGLSDGRREDTDRCARALQQAYLAFGNRAATDHQAGLVVQSQEYW